MRALAVILSAVFLSASFIGCYHSKHRPIDVYLTVESDYGSPTPPVGSNYLNYGMTITASVDSPVAAGEGTRYSCTGWTGTGSAPPTGSTNLVAFQITQNSSITWLWQTHYYLTVSSPYGDPQGEGWYNEGETAYWSVTSPLPAGTGIRYEGRPSSGSVLMDGPKIVTVNWVTQYELTIEVLPDGSGNVELSPAGEDGYYDDGEVVTLTANANSGYVFGNWSGDLSGSSNPETLTMDGPKSVTANFIVPVIYVHGTNGDDTNDGLSWETAVKTIQKGIDIAPKGWTVLVANGTYTGADNKNLDFRGMAIHLRSAGGAENCIIDCENSDRGFYFHSRETNAAIVEGFTIRNGVADIGGAVSCDYSSPTITNCTLSGNSAENLGGAVDCYSSSPTITNCTFSGNSAYDGGAVYCWHSSPTITNCTFSGNSARRGGAVCCSYYSPTITNCTLSGNSAGEYGGAVYYYYSSPRITNCRLSGNSAYDGGAVYCWHSSPTITNCTFSGNSAYDGGAVYCYDSSSATFRNSIIWGNTATSSGHQIYVDAYSSVTLSYCCYANGANDVVGTVNPDNCINQNPQFVDAANKNYHLQSTSPCIHIGNNSYVPAGVTTDLDGNPRIYPEGGTVDLGVYEFQP